jgi:hypothetical protein
MVRLGEALRARLEAAGFHVVNRTPLPVVCFQDARHPEGASLSHLRAMADAVVDSGKAWVSITNLGSSLPAIRACITNFRTEESDLDVLIESLSLARPPG